MGMLSLIVDYLFFPNQIALVEVVAVHAGCLLSSTNNTLAISHLPGYSKPVWLDGKTMPHPRIQGA